LHVVAKVNSDQVEGKLSKKCKEFKVLDPKAGQNLCKYQQLCDLNCQMFVTCQQKLISNDMTIRLVLGICLLDL